MLAFQMQDITKYFGSMKANDRVNLEVEKGEIHALVGENGAGKSTLMKILYGIHAPESGSIFINEQKQTVRSPAKAISCGIGMVHQHFMLISPLTVAENIILGREPTRIGQILDTAQAEEEVNQLSRAYHFNIDPRERIENLSVGLQQRVEILKVLYRNADILILDEPTAVLTPHEIEELFAILRRMREQQKTVVFITHKLAEVMTISDRVTVMRRGKVVGHMATGSTTKDQIARMMVGQEVEQSISCPGRQIAKASEPPDTGEPVLSIENLSALNDKRLPALRNITLSIFKGEVLGIAAVEGNGQSELVQVLTGLRRATGGAVTIGGSDIPRHKISIAHIPEDRHKHGLVLDFTIAENFLLGRQSEPAYSSFFKLRARSIDAYTERMIAQFDIRTTDEKQTARELSGGNQQKIVIAREISKNAPLIVVSQPTRGLDINATRFVHQTLLSERSKGKAILLVSSDLSELLSNSDRIAVMFQGEIVITLNAQETSERELGLYMTGAKRKAS